MEIALTVLFCLLSLTIHELGHYEAIRRCGVRVRAVGLLGIPVSFFPWCLGIRFHGGTWWCIHPLIIGAYVQTESEEEINALSVRDQLYIFGSGIVMNIMYAFLMLAVIWAMRLVQGADISLARNSLCLVLTLAFAAWWWRRAIATYILPLLALPILALVAYSVMGVTPLEAVEQGGGGPVAIVSLFGLVKDADDIFKTAAFFSISLGLVNLLPILPLDGGRIGELLTRTWCGKRSSTPYRYISTILFWGLIVYCFGLDVLRVLT